MDENFEPGDAILFMKVGTHAKESLQDIIARKQREIDEHGFAMWGYGGNTCHPRTMVQPFAKAHDGAAGPIRLVMQPMDSNHFADQVRAEEFSIDGVTWRPVPEPINVLGSRYALCIRGLKEVAIELDLGSTRVAVGSSQGRPGVSYVQGRVDKACLDVVGVGDMEKLVPIGLVAEIIKPFAVFLRN